MRSTLKLLMAAILVFASVAAVAAEPFGNDAFRNVWQRTDQPVQQGQADHSWVWGPEPFTGVLQEWYADSPGERRAVQYNDKSRMEINDPAADQGSEWYVTNGLLARDMIRGEVQVGDDKFVPLAPARIAVAGDPDNTFPTYADMADLYNAEPRYAAGDFADAALTPEGIVERADGRTAATEIVHVENNYGIPRALWEYMNRGGVVYQNGAYTQATPLFNWLYVVGYPITDAFWTSVRVDGEERDVLVQAFERRVLTYTPDNPEQYRVEMGNVGQHYYRWRYESPFMHDRTALITSPADGAVVSSPVTVQGFENGTAFEANIVIHLVAENGTLIAEQPTTVARPDIGVPGPFEATIAFDAPAQDTAGQIQVVVQPPAEDSEEMIIHSVNVTFAGSE
jgi:hypothetical protein